MHTRPRQEKEEGWERENARAREIGERENTSFARVKERYRTCIPEAAPRPHTGLLRRNEKMTFFYFVKLHFNFSIVPENAVCLRRNQKSYHRVDEVLCFQQPAQSSRTRLSSSLTNAALELSRVRGCGRPPLRRPWPCGRLRLRCGAQTQPPSAPAPRAVLTCIRCRRV